MVQYFDSTCTTFAWQSQHFLTIVRHYFLYFWSQVVTISEVCARANTFKFWSGGRSQAMCGKLQTYYYIV